MNKQELIDLLQSLRIDATLDENDLDQDELGECLAILGVEEYQDIYKQ